MKWTKLTKWVVAVVMMGSLLSVSAQASQVRDYWFDSCRWNGTSGEVLDHSGNGYHGTAANGAQTNGGSKIINRSAYFDGTDDYIDTGSDLTTLTGSTASLSFWIKTTQTGNTLAWSSPGVTGVENVGSTDDIFWGWLDASGHIGITVGDGPDVKSTYLINDDIWHHIVITRDAANGAAVIYVDGSQSASGTLNTTSLNASFSSLGRIEDGGGTPEYLAGYLDEVEIYDTVLTQSEVTAIYNNESAGKNWDGSTRPPAASCSAYAFDDYILTDMNTSVSDNVLTNDTGGGIQVTSNTSPSHGTLTSGVNPDGSFTYTPASGYTGDDSFTYTITADDSTTSDATVYISVRNIDSALVADYRLDECGFDGTGGDVIDNSINGLNGTTRNGAGSTTGKICRAASFDGTDDDILVPDNDKFDFDPAVGFTVSAWVYVTADNDGVYVSKMSGTGNDDGWDLELYGGDIYFDINGFAAYAGYAKPSVNSWHHIVGVYDPNANNEVILYMDGQFKDDVNYNTTFRNATNDDLTIGSGGANGYQEYYDGNIDEVKIWSRPLSAAEISDMYDNEAAGRNWDNDSDTRVCNTCQCTADPGPNLVSFRADFRSMSSGKDVDTMLSPDFGVNYGVGNDWVLYGRDYAVGPAPDGNNDASYHVMGFNENLEFGKGYWIKNYLSSNVNYSCNLKTVNFDATITDYPACQSANGKCVLVDLVEPNGTNNHGPYIYTLTSFPVSKKIRWDKVRVLIDGTAYPIDGAPAHTLNSTIWRYDGDGNNYTNITPGTTPGMEHYIDPCHGYWVELDKDTAGKDVKLLIPQE